MLHDAMRAADSDTELCPPWWPSLIWWLIHHHKGPPQPPDDPRRQRYDDLFQHVALLTFADGLGHAGLREQAVQGLQRAVQGLTR